MKYIHSFGLHPLNVKNESRSWQNEHNISWLVEVSITKMKLKCMGDTTVLRSSSLGVECFALTRNTSIYVRIEVPSKS